MATTRWSLSLGILGIFALLAGCSGQKGDVLGAAPPESSVTLVRDLKPASTPVVVKGTMIEKCPTAGCWFMLRDQTGVVRVDTKAAGFVVSNIPLNTQVTVAGKVKSTAERQIAATGLRTE